MINIDINNLLIALKNNDDECIIKNLNKINYKYHIEYEIYKQIIDLINKNNNIKISILIYNNMSKYYSYGAIIIYYYIKIIDNEKCIDSLIDIYIKQIINDYYKIYLYFYVFETIIKYKPKYYNLINKMINLSIDEKIYNFYDSNHNTILMLSIINKINFNLLIKILNKSNNFNVINKDGLNCFNLVCKYYLTLLPYLPDTNIIKIDIINNYNYNYNK